MEMSAFAAPLLANLPFESGPFPNHYGQKHRRDPEGQRLIQLAAGATAEQQRTADAARQRGMGNFEKELP
jgi:hypothetical protein